MSSFCKSYSHLFSKKNQHICVSLDVNFNESLTNDVVSFAQLGPDLYDSIYTVRNCKVYVNTQVEYTGSMWPRLSTAYVPIDEIKSTKYSWLSLSLPRLSRIAAYLEVKIWSLLKHENLITGNKILWKRGEIAPLGAISPLFHNMFNISPTSGVRLHIHLLNVVVRFNLFSFLQIWYVEVRISRSISESIGVRDNESRLYYDLSLSEEAWVDRQVIQTIRANMSSCQSIYTNHRCILYGVSSYKPGPQNTDSQFEDFGKYWFGLLICPYNVAYIFIILAIILCTFEVWFQSHLKWADATEFSYGGWELVILLAPEQELSK